MADQSQPKDINELRGKQPEGSDGGRQHGDHSSDTSAGSPGRSRGDHPSPAPKGSEGGRPARPQPASFKHPSGFGANSGDVGQDILDDAANTPVGNGAGISPSIPGGLKSPLSDEAEEPEKESSEDENDDDNSSSRNPEESDDKEPKEDSPEAGGEAGEAGEAGAAEGAGAEAGALEGEAAAGEAGVAGAEGAAAAAGTAAAETAAAEAAELAAVEAAAAATEATAATAAATSEVWVPVLAVIAFIGLVLLFIFLIIPAISGGTEQAGGATPAPAAGEVSGDTKELVKQLLASPNVTFPLDGSSPNGSTKAVLTAVSKGQSFYTTCPGVNRKNIKVNPKMLQFLVDASKNNKIGINAITDKCHSSGSAHYSGEAVDLDLTSAPLSVLEPIAKKYGGTKNSETSHHHFDFPN